MVLPRLAAISVCLLGPGLVAGQSTLSELHGALPLSGSVEAIVRVRPGAFTLYVSGDARLFVFDQVAVTSTPVVEGEVWNVNISPKNDLLAYVRAGVEPVDRFIWLLPIDPRTGQPAGVERRLTGTRGDVPAISPDGKSVAFARDDATGVGQSILVVSLASGTERIVAPSLPGSVRGIWWTPDGTALYFGVNAPVACTPEWSCLRLKEKRRRWASIRRVAAGGGPIVTVVHQARAAYPGLSPAGNMIVYGAADSLDRWIVANKNGRTRRTMSLPVTQRIQGWLRGATLLVGSIDMMRGLTDLFIADLSPSDRR